MRYALAVFSLAAGLCGGVIPASSCEGQLPVTLESPRQNLKRDLDALAGDEMEGRGLGQPGLVRALQYAADALRQAGTEPGYIPTSGAPSFLQPVPVVQYTYGADISAHIRAAERDWVVRNGTDMVLLAPGSEVSDLPMATPVFIGYGVSEPERGWDDYAGLDVRGRLVVMLEGAYPLLPAGLQERYADPAVGGPLRTQAAARHGAAGVIIVPPAGFFEQWELFAGMLRTGTFVAGGDYSIPFPRDSSFPVVALNRPVLDALFDQSGFDPFDPSEDYRTFPIQGVEVGLTLDVLRRPILSHNAVGFVQGTDPARREELVVVSAHIDHMGLVDGELFNGANDDASGVALVLELARRFARNPAARPIMFVLFTAEEAEHLGSIHFLDNLPLPNTRVVAGLNLEQVGRSADGMLLTTATPDLLDAVESTAGTRVGGRMRPQLLDSPRSVQGTDSFSFLLHGISLVSVNGGSFPEYHTPEDDVALIDFDLLASGLSAAADLTRRLANPGDFHDEM